MEFPIIIMLTCTLTSLIIYGVPLYYSLTAVKLGSAAPEETKKWSVYWLVTFFLIPFFYIISFLGWYSPILLSTITSIVKLLVAVWLYHPHFEGALLINQLLRPVLEKQSGLIDKIFDQFPVNILKLRESHQKLE